jgi:hypothetical protein
VTHPNDDVIEDYQEVDAPEGDILPVASARGGPVEPKGDENRPRGGPKPPKKGKIAARTARNIWIACIVVSVLGGAAVVADLVWDPLKRRGPRGSSTVAPPVIPGINGINRQPRQPRQPLTEKQMLAREFAMQADRARRETYGTRVHDFVLVAVQRANLSRQAALDDRANEELWLEAWKAHYHALYALELYKHLFPFDVLSLPATDSLTDLKTLETAPDDELKDEELRRMFGYYIFYNDTKRPLDTAEQQMLSLQAARVVREREAHREAIEAAQARYEAARMERVFDEADLEDVNRPPRGEDEPAPY